MQRKKAHQGTIHDFTVYQVRSVVVPLQLCTLLYIKTWHYCMDLTASASASAIEIAQIRQPHSAGA